MRRCFLVLLSIAITACRAEEPKHAFTRPAQPTDALKSLTVDQARQLNVSRQYQVCLGGLTSISVEVAEELAKSEDWLYLEGLKHITPEVARALSKTSGGVVLSGLTSLSPEVAEQLAKIEKTIYLDGLKSLSPRSARALASHKGLLSLGGLTACDEELTSALLAHEGRVYLAGVIKNITVLTDARFAEMLAKGIMLDTFHNLTDLSVDAAEALSTHATSLSFPKLKHLSRALAEHLIQTKYCLYLDGIETLERDTAEILSRSHNGAPDLTLNGLVDISADTAEALGQKVGALSLDGLVSLSPQSALGLAKHRGGPLSLRGLKSLDKDTALALSKCASWIHLGVPELTVATAKALAAGDSVRGLTLTRLAGLTPHLAEPLVENEKLILELPTLKAEDISSQLSTVFSRAKCRLHLSGVTELTSQLARDLGFYSSRVELTNLRTINPEQARLLAGNSGLLEFPLIETLDAETLAALASQKGILAFHMLALSTSLLNGLETHEGTLVICKPSHPFRNLTSHTDDFSIYISKDAAAALIKHRGPVILRDVRWLSPEVTTIFSKRTNELFLSDLELASENTLKVLRSNPNIILPENIKGD